MKAPGQMARKKVKSYFIETLWSLTRATEVEWTLKA